jgi:flavin-binding protein dodecin
MRISLGGPHDQPAALSREVRCRTMSTRPSNSSGPPRAAWSAIRTAVAKASQTLRNLRWFEVVETRGHIEGGQVAHWQVTLKIGFTLEGNP